MYTETRRIPNLYTYLKHSTEKEIVVLTSRVNGGWHDNEFDAHAAGYNICIFRDPALTAQKKFDECYRLTRK